MKEVIKVYMKHYTRMEIRDVFKLIYQSEFGGGHMIKDSYKSLEWIQKEHEFVKSQNWPKRESVCEDIGSDMCRIYLESLDNGLSRETLNEMFVQSANTKQGTIAGLEEKLGWFVKLCETGEIAFDVSEVRMKICDWKEAGYPAIHHSEIYRDNYFPAYRVVMKKYAERLEVFRKIDSFISNHLERTEPVIVAIDGMAGSGKSVLGQMLSEIYSCNLFHMDDFFLQPHQRTAERFAEPGGNVDYERFKIEVLDHLADKDGLWYQKYDCSTQSLKEKEFVPYSKLVVIEGAYSLHPHFEDRADIAFFLEIPDELQKERIYKRNGEWMLKRFVEEWIPMEHKYFEEYKIREKATRI